MKRVRLVKVMVQPLFVIDDGKDLLEVDHPATVIPASEWPTYSSERFPREVAEWEERLGAEEQSKPSPAGDGSEGAPEDLSGVV